MKIEVWSDFSCPFCYIGKTIFEETLNKFEHKDKIEVIYKSYQLNPNAPFETNEDSYTVFSKTKGVSLNEAKNMFMQTVVRAKEVGLTFDYDNMKMTNTFKAHRLAKWARTLGAESQISQKLFDGYFTKGLNINDNAVLLDIVKSLNLDVEAAKKVLESDSFKDEVESEIADATQIGVRGVPFFVLDRKYAVSGAQPAEMFKSAIEQAYKEANPFQTLGSDDEVCGPDGCAI